MDVSISQQIAELRREIEGLQELAKIYRSKKAHTRQDRVANELRIVRLEAIMKELATLRSK